MYEDKVTHYVCTCSHTTDECEHFWQIIHNTFSVDISSYLYNLEDHLLVHVLLGGPCACLQSYDIHISFLSIAVNFMNKLMDQVNLL